MASGEGVGWKYTSHCNMQYKIKYKIQQVFADISAIKSFPTQTGILHTTIKAQDGLVTLSVPTGMRIYFDHMGRHHEGEMVTNFCMSGPAFQVIEALKTAQYTPLKNFKGITQVVVEYGMTRTSLQHTYGIPKGVWEV